MSDAQRERVARMPLMRAFEVRYRDGDLPALAQAIATCAAMRWPWPHWLEEAARKALEDHVLHGRPLAPFGAATPRKRADADRNEALLQCYEQLQALKRAGDLKRAAHNLHETLTEFAAGALASATDSSSTVKKWLGAARAARATSATPPPTAILAIVTLIAHLGDRRLLRANQGQKISENGSSI